MGYPFFQTENLQEGPGALDASSGCTDPASDCVCASMRMISCKNAGLFWFSATMRCKSMARDAGQSRRNKRALLLHGRKKAETGKKWVVRP